MENPLFLSITWAPGEWPTSHVLASLLPWPRKEFPCLPLLIANGRSSWLGLRSKMVTVHINIKLFIFFFNVCADIVGLVLGLHQGKTHNPPDSPKPLTNFYNLIYGHQFQLGWLLNCIFQSAHYSYSMCRCFVR